MLFEGARDFGRAADYCLLSARNAVRIFANHETVALARRGLKLLAKLPETKDRARRELALLITLGPPLKDTEGWAAPEVEQVYSRAHELSRQIGQTPKLFPALWGLWMFNSSVSKVSVSREMGMQLLDLAEQARDSGMLLQAHHALASTYVIGGDSASTLEHAERAIRLYDPEAHREHKFLYGGHDPGTCCLSWAAQSLWMKGFPERSMQRAREAIDLATELTHPTSLALTLFSL